MSKSPPQGTHKVFGGVASMLRAGLVDALTEHKPLERRAPRQFNGPKPVNKGGPTKGPDALVLEVRRLHERVGLSAKKIQAALAEIGIAVGLGTIECWMEYRTRPHLVPDMEHGPYL